MKLAINMSPYYELVLGRRTKVFQVNLTLQRGGLEGHIDFLANFNLSKIIFSVTTAAEDFAIMPTLEIRQCINEAYEIVEQGKQDGAIGTSVGMAQGNVSVEVREVFILPGLFLSKGNKTKEISISANHNFGICGRVSGLRFPNGGTC